MDKVNYNRFIEPYINIDESVLVDSGVLSLTISIFINDQYYYACYLHLKKNIIYKKIAQIFPPNISKFQVSW